VSTPPTAQPVRAAEPAPAASPSPRPSLGAHVAGATVRLLLALSGAGLLVGFFMPWLTMGNMVVISGFSLVASSGELVASFSGPGRLLLFAIPAFGIALICAALMGRPRLNQALALTAGASILGYGLFTLIKLFFDSTGLGMWLVVLAALLALAIGLIGLGSRAR
jgi:hypothetical protein